MKEPFLSALPVLKKLQKKGFAAYFVGGSVRDTLMGRTIGDIDIATSATPEQVIEIFPKTIPIGIDHGTIMVLEWDHQYEVTTFRIEGGYDDYRHPNEVHFIHSIEEDLSRRDFTINAIAMDINGRLIDPFNGRHDIERKLIRTVRKPQERFSEDPLRIMRAVRFLSELSFSLDDKTLKGIEEQAHLLENIAMERIRVEMDKLLLGENSNKAMKYIVSTGLCNYLPFFKGRGNNLLRFTNLSFQELVELREYWALIAYLLEIANLESFLREWKSSKGFIKEVQLIHSTLFLLSEKDWTKEIVYNLGNEISISSARVNALIQNRNIQVEIEKVRKIYDDLPIKSRGALVLTGNDLMGWYNKKPGPWIAECLKKVELAILNKEVKNEKQSIKRWLEECNQK